ARLLNDRGALMLEQKRLRLARSSFEEALELVQGTNQRDFVRALQLNLVEANVGLGDARRALRRLSGAVSEADADRVPISVLYWQGRLQLEPGDPGTARSTLLRALTQETVPDWTWRLQYELGRAEEAASNPTAAEERYRLASHGVEEMRAE